MEHPERPARADHRGGADRPRGGGERGGAGAAVRGCWRRGLAAGAAMEEWSHVRLFSAWSELGGPGGACGSWRRPAGTGSDPDGLPDRRRVARGVPPAPRGPLDTVARGQVRYGATVTGWPGTGATSSSPPAATASPSSCTCGPPTARSGCSPGGGGRLGHLDPAQPARCGRLPRARRARQRGPDPLRHPGLPRPRCGRATRAGTSRWPGKAPRPRGSWWGSPTWPRRTTRRG